MAAPKGLNSGRITILSIAILDIILMTLFILFSDLILKDFQNSANISTLVISTFAFVVPGSLIILIIYQFYKLHKNRKKFGFSIKKNIVIYYTIATIIIVVPQTFISINFFRSATDNWLNREIKEAVDIGLDMAIDIHNTKTKELENLKDSSFFLSLLNNTFKHKNITIKEFSKLNSTITSIEWFNEKGDSLYFIGNNLFRVPSIDINKKNYLYPKLKIDDREFLSYQVEIKGSEYKFVTISSKLDDGFSEKALKLTKTKTSFNSVNPHKTTLNIGFFIYYSFFSIPLFLLAILGSFMFSDEIIKPITNIEDAITSVSKGNYSFRILSKKSNEYNKLVNSFNNMIKEIETSRNKLKHTEQISTWQDIAARLAHEIRNPLTPIKLSAQRVLLKNQGVDSVNKPMQTIIDEVTKMEKLLTEFRNFARFPSLNLNKENLADIIQDSILLYKNKYPEVKFILNSNIEYDISIDKSQISQVITNLLINAIHATDEKGEIDITLDSIIKKDEPYCKISIKDNGHGISKENLNNIFKPYYTTKYDGTGLGLAIVNKIILDHKGKIWIESAENRGTTFYIELPKDQLNE